MATKQHSITWTFWMAFLLQVTDVCGNITPIITSNTQEFYMDKRKTLTCSLSTTHTNSEGVFPLKWTKKSASGVIIRAKETTQNERGNSKLYTSIITFTVTKYMNGDSFICMSNFVYATWNASRDVIVFRPPDAPIIRGPSVVRCGQTAVWTCKADHSSFDIGVLWVDKNGIAISLLKQDWHITKWIDYPNADRYIDQNSIYTWYTAENNLTQTIAPGQYSFPVYCIFSSWSNADGEFGKAEVRPTVTGSCAG